MQFLPKNFNFDKYGLHVRFVDISDAQFIIDIRTDLKNQRYIHDTDSNLQNQINYISRYKYKESLGEEYYFLFEYNNKPQGVYRIYNRHEDWCTTGSWAFSPNANKYSAIKALVITHEIVFDNLGYDFMRDVDGINEYNTGVINVFKLLGATFDGERIEKKGRYLTFNIDEYTFNKNKNSILRVCGVDVF